MSIDANTFIIVYSFLVFVTVTLCLTKELKKNFAVICVTVLAALCACLVVSLVDVGRNPLMQLGLRLIRLERTTLAIVFPTSLLGILTGSTLVTWSKTRRGLLALAIIYPLAVGSFLALPLKNLISPYLSDPNASGDAPLFGSAAKGFVLEKIADLAIKPTAMSLGPDGNLYIAGYGGTSLQNGNVVRVTLSEEGLGTTLVVARYLTRPHGVAFMGEHLYVSRAGQNSRAQGGQLVPESTGAITRLRDLNGDGVFDFYEDIVTGLPGAQNPDGLHQNNAILFDSQGRLFITVGAATDHSPSTHKYAGCILVCDADGADLRVFAKGLRNPYGLAISKDGALYCSDNDANNRSTGDEINRIEEGGHYGFPYTSVPELNVTGSVAPIITCTSAQGLAFASSELPDLDSDSLLVASYGDDQITQLKLDNDKKPKLEFFAKVPSAIDVVVAEDGTVYACSHHESALYRIRHESVQ